MSLTIKALKGIEEKGRLNGEWMLLVNQSERPFNAEGCSITVSRTPTGKARVVTTFKAGLMIQAGETCRLVTGSSGKGSHGEAPQEEGIRNFHLFLKVPYLDRSQLVV